MTSTDQLMASLNVSHESVPSDAPRALDVIAAEYRAAIEEYRCAVAARHEGEKALRDAEERAAERQSQLRHELYTAALGMTLEQAAQKWLRGEIPSP